MFLLFINLPFILLYRKPGEKLLRGIMNQARKNKLLRFDLKLICALHLLERYASIAKLVPSMGGREMTKRKFGNSEHLYLPIQRINLYLVCENLGSRYEQI